MNGIDSLKLEILERTPKGETHQIPLLFVHGMFVGTWIWDEFFLPFFAENGYSSVASACVDMQAVKIVKDYSSIRLLIM